MRFQSLIYLPLSAAVAVAALMPLSVQAQGNPAGGSYVTEAGDDLLKIADKVRTPKATVNQMALALARANKEPFKGRPGLPQPAGVRLTVPDEAAVLKADPRVAEIEVAKIWRGEQYYKAGQALEKSKDVVVAFDTYTYAAELGHGPSQLRLAQLYDRGLPGVVQRDLMESIRWYEKARNEKVPFASQRPRRTNFD